MAGSFGKSEIYQALLVHAQQIVFQDVYGPASFPAPASAILVQRFFCLLFVIVVPDYYRTYLQRLRAFAQA